MIVGFILEKIIEHNHIESEKVIKKYIDECVKANAGTGDRQLTIPDVIHWVAITEKLPIVGEWVLCGHNKDEWVDRGTMDTEGNFANDECDIYPTHWAELPEPPCV